MGNETASRSDQQSSVASSTEESIFDAPDSIMSFDTDSSTNDGGPDDISSGEIKLAIAKAKMQRLECLARMKLWEDAVEIIS